MTIIDRAMMMFPGSNRGDWREENGAAIHRDAVIIGDAVIRGGVIRGGVIRGGVEISGGVIYGDAEIRGDAVISGGWIYGDAEIRGGLISGGWIYGDAEIRGGWISSGVYTRTPILLCGMCEWPIVVQGDEAKKVAVGCESHTWDEWWQDGPDIAEKYETEWQPVERALRMAWKMVEAMETSGV